MIALLAAALVGTTLRLPEDLAHWAGMTLRYLPFFAVGVLMGLHRVRGQLSKEISLLAAAAALSAVLFAPQLTALAGSPLLPSLMACIGIYFSAALLSGAQRFVQVLAYLGASAMAIYVLHTIFSAGARETLLATGIAAPGTHLAVGILAGIALPILVRETCLRIRVARPLALA